MDDADLADLIARSRSGEEAAIRTLLDHFENDVRMMVRARLPRLLRSQFDSVDFVQAVWQTFFTGPDAEPARFENAQHLRCFLAGVVRNKVLEEHRRRTRTRKYDLNREEPLYIRRGDRDVARELPGRDPSPSQDAQAHDRLAQILEGRTALEAEVIRLRRDGMTFGEIAEKTGLGERKVRRIIESVRAAGGKEMAVMPCSGPGHGSSGGLDDGSRRGPGPSDTGLGHSEDSSLRPILDEFVSRWERGESPRAEEYLERLPPDEHDGAIELIYQEFCLAATSGLEPDPAEYLSRFPSQSDSLIRLFRLHDAYSSEDLLRGAGPLDFPASGDEIGPYLLGRELGRGAFARVFLARQADLDDRLVVVKVSMKVTPEHRLLARARHPHIVEVLNHGLIDDGAFQMICMPFLGGASLAAVWAGPRRPGSGRELLAELDRVSAPEYSAANRSRPSRDLIAGLSYPAAIAWVVARLAEALDHAYACGVAHGDVKPSNVLLTADGCPMLLDFNLAVGRAGWSGRDALQDAGGTPAYMAPERLSAVAEPGRALPPRADDRHRADVYSLGAVLLEALTGRPPALPEGPVRTHREVAAATLKARAGGPAAHWRFSRRMIPSGLRSILRRCLAPEPADRYRRASELAEDLDCWRKDLPLVFAPEPAGHFGLVRWSRRNWLTVASAAVLLAAATALVAVHRSWSEAEGRATAQLAHYWDRPDSGVYRFRRFDLSRAVDQGDPAVNAWVHLAHYGVTETTDWRGRDEFRDLPRPLQEELEVWLLEQALRYAAATNARRDAPEDWRNALAVLGRVGGSPPLDPLEAQSRRLRQQLGLPEAPDPADSRAHPSWAENYLRGVEAEIRQRPAREELDCYAQALAQSPRSFWANYRAATVCYRQGNHSVAADHLFQCIEQRPRSSALHVQLAGCLYEAARYEAALAACDRALELEPGCAEAYLSHSFIRKRMGQEAGRDADVRRFELLSHRQGKATPGKLRLDSLFSPRFNGTFDPEVWDRDLPARILAVDPEDTEARVVLVAQLIHEGQFREAIDHCDRILQVAPGHLWALYYRAYSGRVLQLKGMDRDLDQMLGHPQFEDFLREYPFTIFNIYYHRSWSYLAELDVPEARLARDGLAHAERLKEKRAEMHFALARVYAVEAVLDPLLGPFLLRVSSTHLREASTFPCWFDVRKQFSRDPAFLIFRPELTELMRDGRPVDF